MSFTTPGTAVAGSVLTAAWLNTYLRDDISWLALLYNTAGAKPVFIGYSETKTAPTISANVLTLDLALGSVFAVSMNANITTLTLQNIPASGQLASFELWLTGNGTIYTFSWFASTVVWPGGSAPTRTSTNNKKDMYTFQSIDGGTTWYGFVAGQNA